MKGFVQARERELLLLFVTMLGVARWWMPRWNEMENMYSTSHWALSYEAGLVRRGLIGALVRPWMPVVTLGSIHLVAACAFALLLLLLGAAFVALLGSDDGSGGLTRFLLLFAACPSTLAMLSHNIGRFDLFLAILTLVAAMLIDTGPLVLLVPVLMTGAIFLHEGFLLLWAPTLLAMMLLAWAHDRRRTATLVAGIAAAIGVAAAFLVLYRAGTPAVPYEEFVRLVQARADFHLTELSLKECYFRATDHMGLTLPYFSDAGAMINLAMALLILSPFAVILGSLWRRAIRRSGPRRWAVVLLLVASVSGLALFPVATDFGRWLSAMTFCNVFALLFLMRRGLLSAEDLAVLSRGSFPALFLLLFVTYLLFGPLHDWMPYPYQGRPLVSLLAVTAVLAFHVGYVRDRASRLIPSP